MRLAIGALVITLVVILDSIECASEESPRGSRSSSHELNDSDDESILYPPLPHLRRAPEPFPEQWIRYPHPYYYDEHGVIRDYMNPGSEGIVVHNMLVGMRRANGQHDNLMRGGRQFFIKLNGGAVIFRERGSRPQNMGVGAQPYRRPTTVLRPRPSVASPIGGVDHPTFSGLGHPHNNQGDSPNIHGHQHNIQDHPSSSQGEEQDHQSRPSSSNGHSPHNNGFY